MTRTETKDVVVITTGWTLQQLLENVNVFLSLIAGIFTAVYACSTCVYSVMRLVDYLKQRGRTIKQLESIRRYTGLKSIFLNDNCIPKVSKI